MGVMKVAIGDALLTSMWVFSMPLLTIFTAETASFLGVQTLPLAPLFISTVLVSILVITFSAIGEIFGGASFNPAASLTFHAAGLGKKTPPSSPWQSASRPRPQGPRNNLIKQWLVSVTTAILVITGSNFTGAPMNPASAFGWAYVNSRHNSWELYYVYWIGALIGAALGAWVFRFLVSPPSTPPIKQKKA
ncbi:Two-component response regulator ARR8 [Hibiscus syriacus]|uniref:Two-component response regulator ARR8 n=1 Tax=Hibiscus syriacus TaxID=106335 RepID=A0A6A2Y9F2_HIBSY|nr:Two-component response regulator ARR8 [Hibiscus syriacus]